MILLKIYVSVDEQIDIVRRCKNLGVREGGFYVPRLKCVAKMNLHLMCLGLDWDAQSNTYGETRKHDGTKPPAIPQQLSSLVRCAIHDSHMLITKRLNNLSNGLAQEILPPMCPDVCVVNFYTSTRQLGMHQDDAESHESRCRQLPVVSLSLGDSAQFLYGTRKNANKANKVLLESGDVLIFGGKSRDIFHGVSSIIPNTAPPLLVERTKLRPGRLNLTFRQNSFISLL
ncbi:alpha-ketoglutarate-dependent dioxygenase abh1 [Phtheirospermum japonicum]|uniref:Alpha-ketoglutarate-dependent dioxygenase abh1 n=1 Tax=Phtheirospermum japonicum TaxID=374723 RepID=A0A830AY82_9LAMI|nr:alpha-ketoglutarate-dependent dioxygenase abh1 [Phtheirospermum japonicum]